MNKKTGETIPARERLIVALDTPDVDSALKLADELADTVSFYKVGLEQFAAGGGRRLTNELVGRGLKVFADLKLFDVPRTVARATAALADSGAHFLTVHGNDEMLKAAVAAKGEKLKLLAVTALTSLDDGDLRDLGFQCNIGELVLSRAKRAKQCGADGVVSSGLETAALRKECGDKIILVTPGVRPAANREVDDQKRVASPAQVIRAGGDYLVVGRPILDAQNPRAAAAAIQEEIAAALSHPPG